MPARQDKTSVLRYEVRVAARPETVFAYFTDPAKMLKWIGTEATLDPRPGGVCRISFVPRSEIVEYWTSHQTELQGEQPRFTGTAVMSGKFVEIDSPRRLVITWGWERELFATPPQSTTVEISLKRDGEETLLQLAHWRIPAVADAFHAAGWDHHLPRLAIAAGGGDPKPDPWLAAT